MLEDAGWFPSLTQIVAVLRPKASVLRDTDILGALRCLEVPFSTRPVTAKELLDLERPMLVITSDGAAQFILFAHPDLGLQVDGIGLGKPRWIGLPEGSLTTIEILSADQTSSHGPPPSFSATLGALMPQLWPLALLSLIVNLLGLATPLFVMTIYDTALPARSAHAIALLAVGLTLIYVMEYVLRRIRRDAVVHLVRDFEERMGLSLLRKMLALPVSTLSRSDAYKQQTRFRRFEGIRDALSGPLMQTVFDLPFLVVFGAALFLIAPTIGWIVSSCAVLSIAALVIIAPWQRRRDAVLTLAQDDHRKGTEEAVDRLSLIRRQGLAPRVRADLQTIHDRVLTASARAQDLRQTTALCLQALLLLTGLGASYHATRLAVLGELPMGALIAVLILVWRFLTPVQVLTTASQQAFSVFESIKAIESLFAMPEEQSRGVAALPPLEIGLPLQFDQVTLRFRDTAMPALLGVSFQLTAGQIIVVAGRAMSGKTCLAELVVGLHQPSAGRVLLGGRMVRQLPVDDLRNAVAYCPQTSQLLSGTIRENLGFSAPLAEDDVLWQALADADADAEVRALAEGLETYVLGHGTSLSESLMRKVSLAMTFLRPGPVHVFDQPTDGLSARSAACVREAIRKRAAAGAVLLISNDPRDLDLGDRIIVLDRGRVVSNDRGKRGRDRAAALLDPGVTS